ncbi:unnamed protein product [Cylindrotheca closterium]|uniref:Beta-lactamase-related domain-containing protein n=1 Tax=Cylindrotheca closterium TaxID=2856 RepID=A0AAD2JHJ8_9STRA|nr:unnamed protein product [Cylindrotheca closterium]
MKLNLKSLVFFCLSASNLFRANADILDDAMLGQMDDEHVIGASVAYFNKEFMTEPIIRSYGKVSSTSGAKDVTNDTVFMIASVSKVFAGAAVLKLVSQNVIALDDDICNVLPGDYDPSACRNPKHVNTPVTWRMLVTHQSSLREEIPDINGMSPNYGPTGAYYGAAVGNPTCPLSDVVGFYRDIMINKETETTVGAGFEVGFNWFDAVNGTVWEDFAPGTQTLYSNFAIGYIAALVEHATGKTFPAYCKENIFDPLGMTNTAWFREDLPSGVQETMPIDYLGKGQNIFLEDNSTLPPGDQFEDLEHYCFIDYASGSLRTTAKDLSLYLDSMLNYGAPTLWTEEQGLSGVSCAEKDVAFNDCEFGIAWELLKKLFSDPWLAEPASRFSWENAVAHAGFEAGSQTQVILFPESGIYALVLTNTNGNDDDAAQDIMVDLLNTAMDLVNPPQSTTSAGNRGTGRPNGAFMFILFCMTVVPFFDSASK